MSIIEEIAKNNYNASADQIAALAKLNLTSERATGAVQGTYLKILLAGVQVDMRNSVVELEADRVLQQVHERYYSAVLEAITTNDVRIKKSASKTEKHERALERNRRANFARSAKSTLLAFIHASGDVTQLNPATVTKTELHAYATAMKPAKPVNPEVLPTRVLHACHVLEELTRQLADYEKEIAIRSLENSMERLAVLLIELGAGYVVSSQQAVREHKMLKTAAGVFWPVIQGQIGHIME
jgi:hypothetical protein